MFNLGYFTGLGLSFPNLTMFNKFEIQTIAQKDIRVFWSWFVSTVLGILIMLDSVCDSISPKLTCMNYDCFGGISSKSLAY